MNKPLNWPIYLKLNSEIYIHERSEFSQLLLKTFMGILIGHFILLYRIHIQVGCYPEPFQYLYILFDVVKHTISIAEKKQPAGSMLASCLASVTDDGPTWSYHWLVLTGYTCLAKTAASTFAKAQNSPTRARIRARIFFKNIPERRQPQARRAGRKVSKLFFLARPGKWSHHHNLASEKRKTPHITCWFLALVCRARS